MGHRREFLVSMLLHDCGLGPWVGAVGWGHGLGPGWGHGLGPGWSHGLGPWVGAWLGPGWGYGL